MGIELDQIENGVFSDLDQGIGLRVDQGRGVEGVPFAQRELVVAVQEIQEALIDQAEDAGADRDGFAVDFVDALPAIEKRIAARVHRYASLDRSPHANRIACGRAVFQIEEIDVAVHGGIDDLDKISLLLLFSIKVHDRTRIFRPTHERALPGPADAAPSGKLADVIGPNDFQFVGIVRNCAPGAAVAIVIAAESRNAVQSKIGIRGSHEDFSDRE